MTPDQSLALRVFETRFAPNILRNAKRGVITFEETIYLLQSELLQIGHNPYDYCKSAGFSFDE